MTQPTQQSAYDAVYAYIRTLSVDFLPTTVVDRNAIIWRAVNAALDADRAAVLREAADVAERLMDKRYGPDCAYAIGGNDVATELRRMAEEARS